jgi:antitoxin HicB
MWAYPITTQPDDNGTILVSFVDIPEAHTYAKNDHDITERATDCLLTALEAYMKDRRPIPAPSRERTGDRTVVLPPLSAAKIELYEAMRNAGVRKAELARRLQWHMPQVDRLFSLRHASRLEHLEAALVALDHRLEVRVVRGPARRIEVTIPRRIDSSPSPSEGRAAYGGRAAVAKRHDVHVSRIGTQWKVTKNSKTVSTHQTQANAIERGRKEARHNKVDLVTHGRDGKIRSKDSYGKDPKPPKVREH